MGDEERKIKDFISENVGFLVVFLVCAVFVLSAIIVPTDGKKSVEQIVKDSAVTFILGLAINRLLSVQGKMNGRRDQAFVDTLKLHGDTVLKISPFLGLLDKWCAMTSAENVKTARERILASAGLRYEDWFGENPQGTLPDPQNKAQKREYVIKVKAIKRARSLRMTSLSAAVLTSEGVKVADPLNLGRTYAEYNAADIVTDVVSKAALAFVFGYYGVELLQDMSIARVIWYAFQTVIMVAFGIIRMNKTYTFITEDYRQRILRKVDQLTKFENWAKEQEVGSHG